MYWHSLFEKYSKYINSVPKIWKRLGSEPEGCLGRIVTVVKSSIRRWVMEGRKNHVGSVHLDLPKTFFMWQAMPGYRACWTYLVGESRFPRVRDLSVCNAVCSIHRDARVFLHLSDLQRRPYFWGRLAHCNKCFSKQEIFDKANSKILSRNLKFLKFNYFPNNINSNFLRHLHCSFINFLWMLLSVSCRNVIEGPHFLPPGQWWDWLSPSG